jgi:hypothetical protein
MKYWNKIIQGLGLEALAYADKESRTCNQTSRGKPNPWFVKLKIPNYPVSDYLKRRINSQIDYNLVNQRANKYLEYQVNRMNKCLDNNPTLFFTIGQSLMHRSTAFRIAMINKTIKGWYQRKTLNSVLRVFFKLPTLKGKTNVKTTRFYVLKTNGKLRPIGCPTTVWKVYLAEYAWLLGFWLDNKLSKTQHAFRPNKGIWTAWLDILANAIPARNIYEFDLNKFFNSIRLFKAQAMTGSPFGMLARYDRFGFNKLLSLEDCLTRKKVPKNLVKLLLKMQTNTPRVSDKVAEVDKLDPELWHVFNKGLDHMKLIYKDSEWSPLRAERPKNNMEYGLTQGSPLSPILAILAIDEWKALRPVTGGRVLYADDGIMYNNSKETPIPAPELHIIMEDLGVTINEKKSGMVKFEGRWQKKLEFLGSVFDPKLDTLNGIHISNITPKNFFQIVGKTYGNQVPTDWDWEYVKDSLLWYLWSEVSYPTKLLWGRIPAILLSGYKKWDYDLPIREGSTMSCAHFLHGIKNRRLFRYKNTKPTRP